MFLSIFVLKVLGSKVLRWGLMGDFVYFVGILRVIFLVRIEDYSDGRLVLSRVWEELKESFVRRSEG